MIRKIFGLIIFVALGIYAAGGDTITYSADVKNLADGDVFYADKHYHSLKDSVSKVVNGKLGNVNISGTANIAISKFDTIGSLKVDSVLLYKIKSRTKKFDNATDTILLDSINSRTATFTTLTATTGNITTGNITTVNSNSVDGVDVSAFKLAYDSHNHGTGTTSYLTKYSNGATGAIGNSALAEVAGTYPYLIYGSGEIDKLRLRNDVTNQNLISFYNGATRKGYLDFEGDNTYLTNEANGFMTFSTNSSEKMRITAGGNVGIGTTNPQANLHISGAGANQFIRFTKTDAIASDWGVGTESAYGSAGFNIYSYTAGALRFHIDGSGNVAIGRTSASAKLDVNGHALTTSFKTGACTTSTLNTGNGNNELYAMDQNVRTTDAPTFSTVNTGQGDNELYDMDQNVLTTSTVTFDSISLTKGIKGTIGNFSSNVFADSINVTKGIVAKKITVDSIVNNASTWTLPCTLSGVTTTVTSELKVNRVDNHLFVVSLYSGITGTSNNTSLSINAAGLNSILSNASISKEIIGIFDNGTEGTGVIFYNSGVITILKTDGSAFTNSGTKGTNGTFTFLCHKY